MGVDGRPLPADDYRGGDVMSYTLLNAATREEWLDQRRKFVTATEIAKLARSRTYWDELRAYKLGLAAPPDISHLPAVKHGIEREPHIAKWVEGIFRLKPNRLLAVRDDGVCAATPDMIGRGPLGTVAVGEIKTVRLDVLRRHMEKKQWPTSTYFDQVQWQMLTTGADSCLFAWEPYETSESGELVPLEDRRKAMWIFEDKKRQHELLEVAEEFLGLREKRTPEMVHILASELRDILKFEREEAKPRAERKAEIQDELRRIAGENGESYDLGDLRISVSKAAEAQRFDSKRFRKDHPDMATEYMTSAAGAQRVTIKEV